ncbi:MAG: 50S ribosomal protein L35 [Acidobacteria bacterium]|nr:50S ribosomal protein L35 [Acidobacteriota bacterium]
MPKLKTHRGAAKRFKMTASGKIVRRKSLKQHILTSKTTKRKRNLRQAALISPSDTRRVSSLLPN